MKIRPINDDRGALSFQKDGVSFVNRMELTNDFIIDSSILSRADDRIMCDSRVNSFVISLPVSPSDGDTIRVIDGYNSFSINPVSVNGNGERIDGVFSNYGLSGLITDFTYKAGEGWISKIFISEEASGSSDLSNVSSNLDSLFKSRLTQTSAMISDFDYTSNGNYVVKGMRTIFNSDVNDLHSFSINEGVAHVEGLKLTKPTGSEINIRKAMDRKRVTSEPHTFTTNGDYSLRWNPIAEVLQVSGIKQISASLTHGGYSGCKDLLVNNPVVEIVSIVQGATTYINGTDFFLDGDYIDWSLTGAEPAPGSTFTVVYRYQSDVVVTITEDKTKITINGLAANTVFYVDYDYYLDRVDRIVLDKNGNIIVVEGAPDKLSPCAPNVTYGLILSTIFVSYGKTPSVTLDYVRSFTNADIQYINNKLSEIAYNIARLSLIENAKSMDPATTKKNTWCDPLYDDDMRDFGISQNAQILDKYLVPGINWEVVQLRQGINITLPYMEELALSQTAYTTTHKVNPYAWESAPPATINLSPASYTWLNSNIFQASYSYAPSWWYGRVRVASTSSSESYTATSAIIPQITITITSASKFNGNENVQVYFDNKFVKNVTANALGVVTNQTFTIPANCMSGSKLVRLIGVTSQVVGSTMFNAQPYARVITQMTTFWAYDPIAQTFQVLSDSFISSFSVIFSDTPVADVMLILCETSAGLPDKNKVMATSRKTPAQVTKNLWCKFNFTPPVLLKSNVDYAIIVETADVNLQVRTAKVGGWDVTNNKWVTGQPYEAGVLLDSSNMVTWSPIQNEDLTFTMNRAKFSLTDTVTLGTLTVTGMTDFMLMTSVENFPATSTEFYIELVGRNNEKVMTPINFPIIIDYSGEIVVKAKLSTSNMYITPVILGDINVAVGKVVLPSNYVSRTIPMNGQDLTCYVTIYEPNATSVKVSYNNPALPLNAGEGQWTKSSQSGVYYYIDTTLAGRKPVSVKFNNVVANEGTITALNISEWGFGDPDSTGTDHLYVRLADSTDPDTKADGFITVSHFIEMTRDTGNSTPVGDGAVDMPFKADDLSQSTTQIEIILNSQNVSNRPYCKEIRVTVA